MAIRKKNIFFSLLLFFAVFIVFGILKVRAGTSENMMGWLWGGSDDGAGSSTGIGWISMNNINPGAGGGVSYGVNIPGGDGDVSGYAWSENIGWVSFNQGDLAGCPDGNCYARRSGNNLIGWVHILSIRDAGVNSGGWFGWVKLSGMAQNGSLYGVKVDGSNLAGHAWSDELGWIDFSRAILPVPPTVSLNANPFTINLESANPSLPQNVTLNWVVSGASTCTKKGGGAWSTETPTPPANGSEVVSQASPIVNYILSCTGPGGTTDAQTEVTTGCNKKICNNMTCESEFIATSGVDLSACVAESTCATDSDCNLRGIDGWKEVAP